MTHNLNYNKTKEEKVVFLPQQPVHIAAPHFVFFIKDYLEQKYGNDVVTKVWAVFHRIKSLT